MLYKAFISYSHTADDKLAPALQHALHRIAKPWYRLRTMRVFRDQTNLSTSPGLWTEIEAALHECEFFIYLASPAAAKSPWVQKEVEWWLTNRSPDTFLIVLTDGVILWDNAARDLDWNSTTALPRRLAKAFSEEPLHTDIRWAHSVDQLSLRHSQFRAAILELAATLLGRPKDELDGDDVRQYRRTRRVAWSAAGVLAALFVLASLAAWLATQQSLLATSRSLASRSEAVLPTNPELALLLAREALRFSNDEQVDYALRAAFLRNPQRMIHHSLPGRSLVAKFVGSDLVIAAEPGKRPVVWSVDQGERRGELPVDADDRLAAVSVSSRLSLISLPADQTSFALYDANTLKPLISLPGVDPRFSRNGKVLTASEGKTIRQWDLPSLQERRVIASLPAEYAVRDVSADGGLLLLAKDGELSTIIIVEAMSGRMLARLPDRLLREGIGFSPDGRFVVTERNTDSGFDLWEVKTGKVRALEKPQFGDIGWTTYVAVSPGGEKFVSGNRNGALHTWDLQTGEWLGVRDTIHRLDIRSIEFSTDGGNMLSVAADGSACLWDAASMRTLAVLGGKGDEAWDVGFAADSKHFLTTHIDGTVRVWNRETWYPSLTFSTAAGSAGDAGRLVLGVAEEKGLQLWDTETGKVKATLELSAGDINSMALDRSAALIAIAPANTPVELWSVQTKKRTKQLDGSKGATALAFTSDGSQLATGSEDGRVRFYSTGDGSLLGEWQASKEKVTDVVAHPDGKRLVVVTWDGWVRVRDMKSGTVLLEAKLDEEGSVAQSAALSEDGNHLLLAGDKFPQIWDLRTGTRVRTLAGHADDVFGGAFSRDGRFILTASGFMQARGVPPETGNATHLWDARSGRLLLSYLSAGHVVRLVSFASDGRRIVAGSNDGKVRRYECEVCLPLPGLADLVSARLARGLSDEERERYLSQSALLGWIADRLPSR